MVAMVFRARSKRSKMFLAENIFMKNNFPKIIFQLKLFFVEINGTLQSCSGS